MEDFETVSSIISKTFPTLPDGRLHLLSRLIVSSCNDYSESLEVAHNIPCQRYGSFRFDCKTKSWVVLYNSYGGQVDH